MKNKYHIKRVFPPNSSSYFYYIVFEKQNTATLEVQVLGAATESKHGGKHGVVVRINASAPRPEGSWSICILTQGRSATFLFLICVAQHGFQLNVICSWEQL